jgi:hypothetical protein
MIPIGTMVPFQFGLESVLAEVIGLVRDGEHYLLRFTFEAPDETTGQYVMTERLVQRDRYFIEGLCEYGRRRYPAII